MKNKSSVLVVDDELTVLKFLKGLLEEHGYLVDTTNTGEEAIKKLKACVYDLIIADLVMENYGGLDILKSAKKQLYNPEVILITGHGSIESAIETIKQGAFDYITKPLDPKRMLITIEQAIERRRLKGEIERLRSQIEGKYEIENIIAVSPKMRKIVDLANMISNIDSTVLIEGESGTGKDVIAKMLHFKSNRKDKPFIPINCGALPEHLLESELFGYMKGAYTGASHDKKGLFEEADCGTILLNEIGDMPLQLQVKLLNILQSGEMRRLGSNDTIKVNVRVIAATNKKLISLVKEKAFREDLYYRLNVIPIMIPPLREHKEDIEPLITNYLEIFKTKFNKDVKGFTPDAIEILINYNWPGNVRELANFVERNIALTTTQLITSSDINIIFKLDNLLSKECTASNELSLDGEKDQLEKEYILKSLKNNNWNQTKVAIELGIGRTSLWRKMKKYDIKTNS